MSSNARPLALASTLVVLLLAAPSAAAFDITITTDGTTATLAPGDTTTVPFTVQMASSDDQTILCAQNQAITVKIEATKTDATLGLEGAVDAQSVEFTIPQNIYTSTTGKWQSDTHSGTYTVTVTDALPELHESHTYGIKASYAGGAPANCQGDFPPASDEVDFSVTLDPPTGEDPNGTADPNGEEDGDTEEGPAPVATFLVVAVGLAFLARRRR